MGIAQLLILLMLCGFSLLRGDDPTVLADFVGSPFGTGPLGVVLGKDGNFYGATSDGVFKMSTTGTLTRLVTFTGPNGKNPNSNAIVGSDGNLYGTTASTMTGTNAIGGGTIYKVTPDGTLTILYTFPYDTAANGLVQGADGAIYGTTLGSFFRLNGDGSLTTLATLDGNNGSLYGATGHIICAKDGNFYGTTIITGGTYPMGVFKVTPTGTFSILYSFTPTTVTSVPYYADWSIIQGADDNFYVMANFSGAFGQGVLVKIDGSGAMQTVYSFAQDAANGNPNPVVTEGADGNFYGSYTGSSTTSNKGEIFKITPAGVLAPVIVFDGTNGAYPHAPLIVGQNGNFYGTMRGASADSVIFQMTPGGSLTSMAEFLINGREPDCVVKASDGNFYGTTLLGGSGTIGTASYGTIFKVDPSGTLTTLYWFHGDNGAYPNCLVESSDGNFYGTATSGTAGMFFKMTPGGEVTPLTQFPANVYPNGIVEGIHGNFYGSANGDNGVSPILFRVTPTGSLTTLVTLSGTQGGNLQAPLIRDASGTFYGATSSTVFSLTPKGEFTLLAQPAPFTSINPGSLGKLAQGSDGSLFGISDGSTIVQGGASWAFKVTPGGTVTYLASLVDLTKSGSFTFGSQGNYSGLLAGADGNFYFTVRPGGENLAGSIVQMTPKGLLTTVASFNGTNGAYPVTNLIQPDGGLVYGVTSSGGLSNEGVLFSMPPPVRSQAQTISFPQVPDQVYDGGVVVLSAVASSGLPITYKVSGPVSIFQNDLSITGAGTVTLTARQPGNAFFEAASPVTQTFQIEKEDQVIMPFALVENQTYGDAPFFVTAPGATSGLNVTVTVQSGPATFSRNKVKLTGAGAVTLMANQAGDANYNAAAPVTTSFVVHKATQVITFPAIGAQVYEGKPIKITLDATASSGLAVRYEVTGAASVSGKILTITGKGSVAVSVHQPGNADYKAADAVMQTIRVKAGN